MRIQTLKTADDIVQEETGQLMLRVIALRVALEQAHATIAKLEAEIAAATQERRA